MNKTIILFSILISISIFSCKENKQKLVSTTQNLDSLLALNPNDVNLLVKRGNFMLDSFLLKYNKVFFDKAKPDATKAFRLDSTRIDTRMLYADV